MKSRFQGAWVELFFKEPPREHFEWARLWPIACVYDEDGELTYVNQSYLIASGIIDLAREKPEEWKKIVWEYRYNNFSLIENVKYLAKEKVTINWIETSRLFDVIYDHETIEKIHKNYSVLDEKWWYKDIFRMKLTGKYYLWKTLENKKFKWNIRSAIEVYKDHPLITKKVENVRAMELDHLSSRSFWFWDTIEKFKRVCDFVLKWWSSEEMFQELKKISAFWDVFIDEWLYLTRWFDGVNHYANKQFLLNSTFMNHDEIVQAFNDWNFAKKLYWSTEKDVKVYLESLEKQPNWHYNGTFFPIIFENLFVQI